MPPRRSTIPAYLFHKATGEARVNIYGADGKRHTVSLGKHGTPESRARYLEVLMATKKPTGHDKPKPYRSNSLGVQFYTDQETVDAINAYLASLPRHEGPTKRSIIEAGVHIFLASKGFWPMKK